jgi:5-methylcytosine-specific restriction endonuclease McrA
MAKINKTSRKMPPPTVEHRRKISDSLKKLELKRTEAQKRYLSEIHKGSKNPQWKGGVTPLYKQIRKSKDYDLWRRAVYERDNYTCVWCGYTGKKLVADHIKPFAVYPELRFAIDNGRTLCIDCHKKTDTYGVNYNLNKLWTPSTI